MYQMLSPRGLFAVAFIRLRVGGPSLFVPVASLEAQPGTFNEERRQQSEKERDTESEYAG